MYGYEQAIPLTMRDAGSGSMSSLMSIATSLKRAGSKSSKMSTSTFRSTSTTDSIVKQPMAHLFPSVPTGIPVGPEGQGPDAIHHSSVTESTNGPLEKVSDLLIAESVIDASKLQKERSTIRLVTPAAARLRANASQAAVFATPKLKPFNMNRSKTEDDGKEHIGNAFLSLDDGNEDIGNAFLAMDARSFTETIKSDADVSNATAPIGDVITRPMPQKTAVGTLTPQKSNMLSSGNEDLSTISPPKFIFGSPINAVTNDQFGSAAVAVLEEMNKRLGLASDSAAAVRLGADGTIDFGESTPSGKTPLNLTSKKIDDTRYGRAHEKLFKQCVLFLFISGIFDRFIRMESITTHYAARRPPSPVKTGTLVGTKRKSTAAFDDDNHGTRTNASKRVIYSDDPKDKMAVPPPPKRQRVDGAILAQAEKASIVAIKENEAALKKAARGRRSSKGRASTAGSAARRRSITAAKVAPSGRFGLLRSGAAKVVKTILSTVSNAALPKVTQTSDRPNKAPVVQATTAAPIGNTSASAPNVAPKVQTRTSFAPVAARPSSLAPRASATTLATSRKSSLSTVSSTRTSLAPKGQGAPSAIRVKPTPQRGGLPAFEVPIPAPKNSITASESKRMPSNNSAPIAPKRTNVVSRTSVTSTMESRRPSATRSASTASLAFEAAPKGRRASKNSVAATASVTSKMTLDSVQEAPTGKVPNGKSPDFEPELFSSAPADENESRPSSPLPAPPASLSSRPLQRRFPLESVQPGAVDEKGSLSRRPRISRSKVIAKVHAHRLGNGAAGSAGSSMTAASKGRKSGGASMGAKAKLMGGEGGGKARASVAAEAVKRKARVSGAAGARRRTMAVQQATLTGRV